MLPPRVFPKQKCGIYEEIQPCTVSPATNYETITLEKKDRAERKIPKHQQQQLETKSSPTRTSFGEILSKPLHQEKVEMRVSLMAKQIKDLEQSMVGIVKQMDEVLMSQARFEAELSVLRETSGLSNGYKQEEPVIHIGMSSAHVSIYS